MARFSRLRLSCLHRSARLLLLATGCFGISAAPAWSCIGAQEFNSRSDVVTTSKAVAVDAYISGFKTLLGELNTQKFDNQPLLTNGSTLAKAILKQNARQGKNILQETTTPAGEKANPPFSAVAMSGLIQVTPLEQWTAEIAATEASRYLMNAASPTPVVQIRIGVDGLERIGIDFDITPRIIIAEEEESLLGMAAEALETVIQPLLEPLLEEPGLLAISDAAPLDNPPAETNLAEYMPHLPAGDDAPTENPELEASAALVVSATMSPDEYLAAFQDRIIAQQETNSQQDSSAQILPVAHHETIQVSDSPALRALGGPISVASCESETCRGFTIQFAPLGQPAAEARVFDGPAQIKLCDTSGTDSGTVEPAVNEESPREESLDEIAARLQRQFLARAMSGEFDQPGACPAETCHPCPAEKSAAKTCPPCTIADCPGFPAGSPCCPSNALPTLSAPPVHARSQWTLPTPAVTYNPYAQSALPQHGPGYGTVLPRDWEFYAGSPMVVPVGPPCGPAPAAYGAPPTATTFAAPPHMGYQPQPTRPEYPSGNSPYPGVHAAAAPASRLPISHESLETHREISRSLDQLAERCESQGMYDKADQLRELARENRMSARAIHGQLSTLPMPMPYAVPAGYYPEMGPMMLPPAVNPPTPPPALPIAQPIMVPRY